MPPILPSSELSYSKSFHAKALHSKLTTHTLKSSSSIIMKSLATFLLFPLALGCLNPTSNSCASYIKSNSATASPFCATFTKSSVTATTSLPSWATNCSNKPSMISAECSCHYSGSASSATATATTQTTTTGGGGTVPTGVTTTLPASAGATSTSKAITVTGSFDGGMKKYDRSRKSP